jgi:hypothetical protein
MYLNKGFAAALRSVAVTAFLAATAGVALAQENQLTLRTATGEYKFNVEVVDTNESRAQGLMFRTELADDAGMLFDFKEERKVSFWMQNTLIPLDMIFIRPDGTIGRIAVNTVPHSLDPVAFNEPTAAVLELAGGRTVQLGIKAGDRVSWPGGPSRP